MNVAFTIDRLDPAKGGAERVLDRLGSWLVGRGHEVIAVVREARLPADSPLRVETVDAPRWPRGRAERGFARAAADRAEACGADAVLAVRHALRCTVYQPHGGIHADTLAAGLESREPGPGRTLARIAASVSSRHRTFLAMERELLGGSEPPRFVALGTRVERSALGRYPGLRGRTSIVPNGVDVETFHPRLREEARASVSRELDLGDRALALLLAHNPRLKGIVPALRALAAAGGDAFFVAAGRGTERFAGLAARLGLASRARFLGPIGDPVRWLAAADVLLHPTFHDPCSLVALEALACGTPVITTERNGVSDLMRDEPDGGVVIEHPRRHDTLVAALRRLLDRDAARRAGARARALAERHPWERSFVDLETILAKR
jgi:UDP-glucose:(heptosyl)LPS alpha-1,3-glucosyltransferase